MTKTTTSPDEPDDFDPRSDDVAARKRAHLLELFPECATEGGKIDFDVLKATLGEQIDAGRERYGLTWPGKAACFQAIQRPSLATLRPKRNESVEFDTTENMIIEGDNLEVLKLLQKSYLGKVKMIYIDPPYNTGKDFIYPDNYTESLQTYLEYTGQVDGAGRKLGTNTEADGRFHSKWLNMMYPRLYLARNLLDKDRGVIFVSIDDHEHDNLRRLLDELFGEENFIANVIWQKKYTRSNDATHFSDNHDHVLVYARRRSSLSINLLGRSERQLAAYSNPDRHVKGPWKATPLHAKSGTNAKPFTFTNGVTWAPPAGTFRRFSDTAMAALEAAGEIWFGSDGMATPSKKTFLSEAKAGVTPLTIWPYDEVGHNHEANSELKAIDLGGSFDNPKPTRLLERMLELTTASEGEQLVLDFFAGSGTTAHAVFKQNQKDGGNRKFILVQLPEPTDRPDYPTIADITKERVRRVIQKLNDADKDQLRAPDAPKPDRGFRVFQLASSNFKPWDGDRSEDAQALQQQLFEHEEHILEGREEEDLLYEILLKDGFELTTEIETIEVHGFRVHSIAGGELLLCLQDNLTHELITALAERRPSRVVFLDRGFRNNDQLKANAAKLFASKAGENFQKFKVV